MYKPTNYTMTFTLNTRDKSFVEAYLSDAKKAHTPVQYSQVFLDDGSSLCQVDNICLLLGSGDGLSNLPAPQAQHTAL